MNKPTSSNRQALRVALKNGDVQQITERLENAVELARFRYHFPDGSVKEFAYTAISTHPTTQPPKPGTPVLDFDSDDLNLL